MPIYEYECPKHGAFEAMKPMSEFRAATPCPTCSRDCSRIVSAPRLALMDPNQRVAHDRNAKSRAEPHVHGPHCNHHSQAKGSTPRKKPQLTAYNGPRPWVVEHG